MEGAWKDCTFRSLQRPHPRQITPHLFLPRALALGLYDISCTLCNHRDDVVTGELNLVLTRLLVREFDVKEAPSTIKTMRSTKGVPAVSS